MSLDVRRVTWSTALLVSCLARGLPGDDGALVHETTIKAPIEKVWEAFTTKAGLESWMAAHAEIDLRVGGKMLTNYKPEGTIGDENTIENTILSFRPKRMLSIKATGAPRDFPFKKAMESTWSVILFEEAGLGRTRIEISGMGYGDDEESRRMREFFQRGNQWTLDKLKEKLEGASPEETSTEEVDLKTLDLLHRLAVGEWIHEKKRPDGSVFLSRSVIERGADGRSLTGKGWLGGADGMLLHGSSLIWREPPSPGGGIRFQSIDQDGAVARGAIQIDGDEKLIWDWDVTRLDGARKRFRVDMTFEDADQYRFQLFERGEEGGVKEVVNAVFTRVKEAPEAFRKVQPAKR